MVLGYNGSKANSSKEYILEPGNVLMPEEPNLNNIKDKKINIGPLFKNSVYNVKGRVVSQLYQEQYRRYKVLINNQKKK